MRRVYLDHHAACPLSDEVHAALSRARRDAWANASSAHREGREARARLEHARRAVAEALGASATDVVLTGGGTEACNLGVLGVAALGLPALGLAEPGLAPLLVITSELEHPAIERSVAALVARGATHHALPLQSLDVARPRLAELLDGCAADTRVLVATQAVSHETGTVIDVAALAALLPPSAHLVVDACQALGKLPATRFAAPDRVIALAGAKIGASAGSGALVVPRGLDLSPRMLGGAQERGRRAGTPDVAAHAGLAAALAALPARLAEMPRLSRMRDDLEAALVARGAVVNGASAEGFALERVATVTNVSFRGWRKATLVAALDLEGVAVSAGAACSSGVDAPSAGIRALHPDQPWRAESCVRFSMGPETTEEDVALALVALDRVLARSPG